MSGCLRDDLERTVGRGGYDRVFILVDSVTREKCLPVLLAEGAPCLAGAQVITIGHSDSHKDIDSLTHVWRSLKDMGATRHSCLVNLGGGMVTDLGGFAASTFKRGIAFVNVPTTLLAMVDASVGGKTGINFCGLKNEIGVFNDARAVIVSTRFLSTLDGRNIRSGYAEMLKHGLLSDMAMWRQLVTFDVFSPDLGELQGMVGDSIKVKERIVGIDHLETGLRKALNFGHTLGHALESLALAKGAPLPHGFAVAFGMACELYLSARKVGFPLDVMRQAIAFIRETYGQAQFDCDDYDTLLELMAHDKKNVSGKVNLTLLAGIGDIRIDQGATRKELVESLDFLREGAS